MNEKKELQLAKRYRKALQKGFGKEVCKELDFDCASCKAQIMIGFVNWHINLLEWVLEQSKRSKKVKNPRRRSE